MAMYNSPVHHSANEPHPFDSPFEVMKALRKDFNELKMAFQAEQQQRAVEVQQLRQEVTMLKDQLQKESHERKAICHQTVNDLTQLRSDNTKSLEEMKVNFAGSLHQLNQLLQDEMRDRRAEGSLRDTRETAEKSERQSENAAIKDDVGKHKQVFFGARDEIFQKINNITHDIEMIATAMSKVSFAKGQLTKESLQCWKYFNGQGSLSTTGSN